MDNMKDTAIRNMDSSIVRLEASTRSLSEDIAMNGNFKSIEDQLNIHLFALLEYIGNKDVLAAFKQDELSEVEVIDEAVVAEYTAFTKAENAEVLAYVVALDKVHKRVSELYNSGRAVQGLLRTIDAVYGRLKTLSWRLTLISANVSYIDKVPQTLDNKARAVMEAAAEVASKEKV